MDGITRAEIEQFASEDCPWPSLTPTKQKALAKLTLRLMDLQDAELDSGYELLRKLKDWLDGCNVVAHRKPMRGQQ